jgi:hypothetical protein
VVTPCLTEASIGHWTISFKHLSSYVDAVCGQPAGNVGIGTSTPSALLDVDGTTRLGGAVSVEDNEVTRSKLKDYSETTVIANTGATYTIDLENGNVFNLTLTGDCTYTFSNPPASGSAGAFTLIQNQDGTGSRTVTWPASVEWAGGSAPDNYLDSFIHGCIHLYHY